MADEKEAEGGGDDQPKAKGKSKLILILVAVNVLAVGGIGAYLVLGQSAPAAAKSDGDEGDDGEDGEEETSKSGFGPLVEMKPIVANLHDRDAGRYIKVTPYLEVKSENAKTKVEETLVPIRSRMLLYFTSKSVEDTVGDEKKAAIQEDLKKIINEELGSEKVKRVFFTEFVIQ